MSNAFDYEAVRHEGRDCSEAKANNAYSLIYEQVKRIPVGRVATYGQIAALAGNPRWARVVGFALHVNPSPGVIPCHRVVNRNGRVSPAFAFGGANIQIALLKAEGVCVVEDTVDLSVFGWTPLLFSHMAKRFFA